MCYGSSEFLTTKFLDKVTPTGASLPLHLEAAGGGEFGADYIAE